MNDSINYLEIGARIRRQREQIGLTQEQLARTLMPAGRYSKEEIRQMAEKIGLDVAKKPDSQEICFIPDHDYARFIREHTASPLPAGNFVGSP